MENPFFNSPSILAKHWRSLRKNLTADKTDLEHLQLVANFWSQAPISAAFLDWDQPGIWFGPWELIAEKDYDISSVALGIEYTLLLAEDQRWSADRLTLALASTHDKSQQLLVLIVDNNYVLNYEWGRVVTIDQASKELVMQQSYQYNNKMHIFKDS